MQNILLKNKSDDKARLEKHDQRHFFSSVQFSLSVVSDSLQPHELQHARPPCPSPTPGVHSDSSPSSWWCHPAISSSVIPFSSCPQSLPALGSFPMSQLFAWGGQRHFLELVNLPVISYSFLEILRIRYLKMILKGWLLILNLWSIIFLYHITFYHAFFWAFDIRNNHMRK